MKALIVVTHLLGTGHLARALVLARAYQDAGHHVKLISGGLPAPHLNAMDVGFVQLPPLQSDGVNFTRLLDEHGNLASVMVHDTRKSLLKQIVEEFEPDLVITELFPFGRRILAVEFQVLLEAARTLNPCPVICASVRDILAPPSKPGKAETTRAVIHSFYDGVLVHSDPEVTPLDASWPVQGDLQSKLHYTGFVAPVAAGPHPDAMGAGCILVSAGGGNVGAGLFSVTLQAATKAPDLKWRILVGGDKSAAFVAGMRVQAPSNVEISPATTEFRHMLFHASASVSLCGYNTALDVLQAGTPAVFVPFDSGGETEQSLRAQALSQLGGIEIVQNAFLTTDTLTRAVRQVMSAPRRAPATKGMNGAARSVEITEDLLEGKRHGC